MGNIKIAKVATDWGASVPFLRPAHLALDDSPGVDPILHALEHLHDYDWVVVLQPTSPFRTSADIDAALELCWENNKKSCVSLKETDDHPNWMFFMGQDERLESILSGGVLPRRQDLRPAYVLNGAIYIQTVSLLKETKSFFPKDTIGYLMPPERSIDIDTLDDLQHAETQFNRQNFSSGVSQEMN